MTLFVPGNRQPVEWLFLDADTSDAELGRWLAATLPHCSWSCHVVVAGGDRDSRLLRIVTDFLEREKLSLVYLHLLADGGLEPSPAVENLLDAAAVFQKEAYRERTGARLVPLPILQVAPGADPGPAMQTAGHLAARLAKPSLLVWDEPDEATSSNAAGLGLRLYLGSKDRETTAMEVLNAAHVLDSVMDRMEDEGSILVPCRPHVSVAQGRVFGCSRQQILGLPGTELGDDQPSAWNPDPSLCADCIADTIAGMGSSLAANRRWHEGRELALRASAALVDTGSHDAAAEVALTAAELSRSGPERVDARIQEGLCRLAGGRLEEADRALLDAAASGAEPGLIAYHRARVQVAWRDDIEALDRFEEVLEHGTDIVSTEDLHFELAMSHIRLEEWSDARNHLDLSGDPSAAIAFNLGVCDVNDSNAARALEHFNRAFELDPTDDDLGRIHFFRGFCLKELERYDEAVIDLQRSIELEEAELAHHNSLGFCLFKLGRHAEAVTTFEQAVAVDPASAIDWANIGVNLERLGEDQRATEMYRKAIGMDGSIGFARDGLERVGGKGS